MPVGGYRPNSGRKSVSEEVGSRELTRSALIKKFGSMERAIEYLLEQDHPVLTKFVYEHALGKPIEMVASVDSKGQDVAPLTIHVTANKVVEFPDNAEDAEPV